MNELTNTNYVVIGTYYNIDNEVCNVIVENYMFSSQEKAKEWIITAKDVRLCQQEASKYAAKNNMLVKFSGVGDDGMNYVIDIVDGDKVYHAIQYTIAPIKCL